MNKNFLIIILIVAVFFASCKKEYITNEYVTNEYYENAQNNYQTTVISNDQEITTDICPDYLKEGDSVAICASSNYVVESEVADGIETLKSWGLKIKLADNVYSAEGRYAGSLSERVENLQKIIENKNIKAIFFTRGGYGASQLLPYVDFSVLKNNPKWLIGYSDITAFHIAINNLGVETIHGPMMRNFNSDKESVDALKNALFGNYPSLEITTNSNCKVGYAEGRLVGGNLSLIYSEQGTAFELNTQNSILFIEDVGEANYSIDRMLTNLKLSGKLNNIIGIVVGDFTDMSQGNDKSIEEIIAEKTADLNIPIMYGLKSGHDTKNLAIYLGRKIKLTVDSQTAKIEF